MASKKETTENLKEQDLKTLHHGHRERMRQRFQEYELDGFQEHEALEMLLYYVIRRGNTNELAHKLLREFGSLHDVMNAAPEQLMAVKGVGEKTAEFLHFIGAFSLRIGQSLIRDVTMRDPENRKQYFINRLAGCRDEKLLVASLDDSLNVMQCATIAKGTPGHLHIETQMIMRRVLFLHCNQVIIAHNHPSGTATPSYEDIAETKRLAGLLYSMEIRLIDHIIVAGSRAQSLREIGKYYPPYES